MDKTITILHLSDLHFPGAGDVDARIVISALLKEIDLEIKNNTTFDFLVFSGDLVKAGASTSLFAEAKKEFLQKVMDAGKIPEGHLIVCPGNHDVDRDIVRRDTYVERGLLDILKTKKDINDFIDDNSSVNLAATLPPPFQRLNNFYETIRAEKNAYRRFLTPFVSVYQFTIADKRIGFACLNSAWRATGEPKDVDKGNLVLGERAIDQAIEKLKDSDIKIAVFHHPMVWLQDADQAAVESRLHAEFDILTFGHLHKASPEFRRTLQGEAIALQGSCLYFSRDHYFNGHNIIHIDPDASTVKIELMEYSDERREFVPATRLLSEPMTFPLPSRGGRQVSALSDTLRRTRPNIRRLANEHISLVGGSSDYLDIETHFVCPMVTERAASTPTTNSDELVEHQIDSILKHEKSIMIIGRSESGKTSLAHYLAVRAAAGETDAQRLPLMGKFLDLKKGDHPLWRLLRGYANEISDGSITRAFLERDRLLVLVDDVDLLNTERMDILKQLIAKHPNVRWILLARIPAGGLTMEPLAAKNFPDFEVFTIRDLTRKAIRALATSWLQLGSDLEKADTLYRGVMEQIQRTGLPRNGYIVALILWAIKNKSQGELLNEAVLIQNIIDYMLGRMDYTGALRSELDFTTKSSILQELAMHFKRTQAEHEKTRCFSF